MTEDHVLVNRANWDRDAPNWVERGRRSWASDEPFWGIWGNPESELHLLPDVEVSTPSSWAAGRATCPRG